MRSRALLTLGVAASMVLSTACGSRDDDVTSSEPLEPTAYCQAIAPLWDAGLLPNVGDDMTSAERATTVTTLQATVDALPQGIELGVLTPEQSDIVARTLPIILALYENPELLDAGPEATAETIGMSPEEFESLNSAENSDIASLGIESLIRYCNPGGALSPDVGSPDVAFED